MERDIRAFFYDYKYYLFPEDCPSLADLKERGFLSVRRLKEEFCMAPDFVYESIAEEDLEIEDPARVFEVSVNLYSRAEYDEILGRQVKLRCPGCERYEDDGTPDLNGHHREMSLEGVCYEREGKNEKWPFSRCAEVFWARIAGRLGELAACIDRNKQKKLNKIFNEELTHIYFALRVYGVRTNGTYRLYLSAGAETTSLGMNIVGFLAAVAGLDDSPVRACGWEVFPFLPAGVKESPLKTKRISFYTAPTENPAMVVVRICHPKAAKLSQKKREEIMADVNDHLAACLGENVTGSVVAGYEVVWDNEEKMTMSALKDKLTKQYDDLRARAADEEGNLPYPPSYGFSRDEGEEGDAVSAAETSADEAAFDLLPYHAARVECMTSVPELTMLSLKDATEGDLWWNRLFGLEYVYLYVPRQIDDPENPMQTLQWYMSNMKSVPEPLRDPSDTGLSALGFGVSDCAGRGFILEMLVFEEKKFFRTLRILAPVLRAYDARAVVVGSGGVQVYACGYTFTPVEGRARKATTDGAR